jgi:hypothetical protein
MSLLDLWNDASGDPLEGISFPFHAVSKITSFTHLPHAWNIRAGEIVDPIEYSSLVNVLVKATKDAGGRLSQEEKRAFQQLILPKIKGIHMKLASEGDRVKELVKAKFEIIRKDEKEKEETYEGLTERFFKHLKISGDLILRGPPNSDAHDIDWERAYKWSQSFCSEWDRALTSKITRNIRYISHSQFIIALNKSIDDILTTINQTNPVAICVSESTKKSDYYIAILFAKLWLDRGNRLDWIVTTMTLPEKCSIINVDDMMYSGGQTINSHQACAAWFDREIGEPVLRELCPEFLTKTGIIGFTTTNIRKQIVESLGCSYYLVRPFMAQRALGGYNVYAKNFLSHYMIVQEIIPDLTNLLTEEEYLRIGEIFGIAEEGMPSTAVYFDHKVADLVSTFLVGIGFGAVPLSHSGHCTPLFIRFIKNCPETMESDKELTGNFSKVYD